MLNLGTGYTTATATFSEPELPGGVAATATAFVKNGQVYAVQIDSTGSGYTQAPSITISGDGSGADASCRVVKVALVWRWVFPPPMMQLPATKFKFKAPVYLMSNTYYAFVVKAPTSLNYTIWTSKLGENQLGTELRVVEQPSLGSLFMSQNGGLWTEDQTQDVTFTMWRASFSVDQVANIEMTNAPLGVRGIQDDPIECNAEGTDLTSNLFGDNPQIVRVYHYNHGMTNGDLVRLLGVDGNPGGIDNSVFDSLHEVITSDFHTFTINVGVSATRSEKTGGSAVLCSYQRPYEVINVVTGAMTFPTSGIVASNRATTAEGVTTYGAAQKYRLDTRVLHQPRTRFLLRWSSRRC